MKSTSSAAGLLAAFLALSAAPAGASPGSGIRLGGSAGRLHPYLDLEGRYDSNVYYASESGTTAGDVILHVRPGFQLEVPGELSSVELAANLDWAQYLGVEKSATKDLSRLYAAAALGLTVNRRGAIGLELDDRFFRDPSTSSFVFSGAVISNRNDLTLRVPWRPGGGALVISPTLDWSLETFEPFSSCSAQSAQTTSCDSAQLSKLGYNDVRAGAEARWKFLPRTSAVLDAGYFSRVPNDTSVSQEVSGVQGRAGFSGLVTPHLGATVKLGYADTLGSTPQSYGTFLATIEGEWLASESTRVRIGWDHGFGFEPDTVYYLYTSNKIAAAGRWDLAGRYGAKLEAFWERRAYAFVAGKPSADSVRVEPGLEAALSRWINASVAYAYSSRAASKSTPGFDYTKHEAWLRFVFTY
jgi:hypothetical protein